MAPRPSPAAAATTIAPPPMPRRGGRMAWVICVCALPPALMALPTALILVAGMVPTLVALLVDRNPEKYAAVTVGSLNFCGVASVVITLWQTGHSIDNAFRLMIDPFSWLIMLGSAAFGWMVYAGIPPAVGFVLKMRYEAEVAKLKATQKELVEEWGARVTNPNAAPEKEPAK
ncbi:hypothetical protein [Inquilinus sp. CAU 1745]|uniref:hypothetical protein n=1 Tax=Inquilinus sp. CAU 1745 TaxID=3140369 RepID=UPI00325B82FD